MHLKNDIRGKELTINEARKLYLKSDCSHFAMCTTDYSAYLKYKCLELNREQEDMWKCEKIQMLYQELQRTGDYRLFERLYKIAAESRGEEKLKLMLRALKIIKHKNLAQQISTAEAILGKKGRYGRDGLVCWAYDIGRKDVAVSLLEQAKKYLDMTNVTNIELEKRLRSGQSIYRKISEELNI